MKKHFFLFLTTILILATVMSGCGGSSSGGNGGTGGTDGTGGDTNVVFTSAVQTGGATSIAESTGLTLTFSADPATLTVDNITVTGATKGALSGTGTTRNLGISNITVANGATVSVTITSPTGYSISGSPKTAVVYRTLSIGMDYLGGKLAYILQPGDPGYDADVPHGLIAAASDQISSWGTIITGTGISGTSTALGTGMANTQAIVKGCLGYVAAQKCIEMNENGYNDWYLPSKDELNKLYVNKDAIGGFTTGFYWSSSQFNNSDSAWYQNFDNGYQQICNYRDTYAFRPVRSF